MLCTLYLSLYKAGVLTQLRYTKEELKKLTVLLCFCQLSGAFVCSIVPILAPLPLIRNIK